MLARLAFSIATIVEPDILIVDEILSVGDVAFQTKSRNKMQEMIKGGTTVLFVSHSIEQIKNLCNRVVWLEHGKIVDIGNAENVCNKYLIEFDGKQHFIQDNIGWGQPLKDIQKRDNYKTQWCKNNDIKLIRISYKQLNTLTINDLIL